MPIYEYGCSRCGHEFELLVNRSTQPACPECESEELEKRFSSFSAVGGAASASSLSGAAHPPSCGCCRGGGGACEL